MDPIAADSGVLCIVATPIGNLGDLSDRAREVLGSADLVVCEDTRHTGRLMAALGLRRPLLSLHEHNERARVPALLERLQNSQTLALVSDAGTPLLSDPGYVLVRECIRAGVRIEPIPGASALLAALVISGLPPQPFTFAGFPPPKRGKRRTFLGKLATVDHTVVLYESPHRILATLEDAGQVFGIDRQAVVARELTKLHEEVLRGRLDDLLTRLEERAASTGLKGEYVLLLAGSDYKPGDDVGAQPSSDSG
jgi:16S rRNA (cytidine1402-2'-O)-methyltransferase